KQQCVVGKFARTGFGATHGRVDRQDFAAQAQVDALVAVGLRVLQRDPLLRRGAGQVVLGQVGPVAGQVGVGAGHGQRAVVAELAQAVGGGVGGGAAADDQDFVGGVVYGKAAPLPPPRAPSPPRRGGGGAFAPPPPPRAPPPP